MQYEGANIAEAWMLSCHPSAPSMIENGIYAAPSQFEAMFVSFAHTEDDIEKTCQVIESFK